MTAPEIDVEREIHHILFDVMDLTVLQEKELRIKFTALCARVAEAEREKGDVLAKTVKAYLSAEPIAGQIPTRRTLSEALRIYNEVKPRG